MKQARNYQHGMQKPKKDEQQEGQDREKPKATTKAERRAKQEAQRAAKEAGVVKVGPYLLQFHYLVLHSDLTTLFWLFLPYYTIKIYLHVTCHVLAWVKTCCWLCTRPWLLVQK